MGIPLIEIDQAPEEGLRRLPLAETVGAKIRREAVNLPDLDVQAFRNVLVREGPPRPPQFSKNHLGGTDHLRFPGKLLGAGVEPGADLAVVRSHERFRGDLEAIGLPVIVERVHEIDQRRPAAVAAYVAGKAGREIRHRIGKLMGNA